MSNLVFEKDPAKRPGFTLDLPGRETVVGGSTLTWAAWADYHQRIGQELAKRMRVYPGPSTDPDGGDTGGTPAAMPTRMAA